MSLSGVYADFFERYFPNLREYESNCRPALEAICAAREPLERRWNLRSGGLRTFPTKVPSKAVTGDVGLSTNISGNAPNWAYALTTGHHLLVTVIAVQIN